MATALIITGIIVVVIAIIAALINVGAFVRNEFRDTGPPRSFDDGDFGAMFTRHVFTIALAVIGLALVAGGILVMVTA